MCRVNCRLAIVLGAESVIVSLGNFLGVGPSCLVRVLTQFRVFWTPSRSLLLMRPSHGRDAAYCVTGIDSFFFFFFFLDFDFSHLTVVPWLIDGSRHQLARVRGISHNMIRIRLSRHDSYHAAFAMPLLD